MPYDCLSADNAAVLVVDHEIGLTNGRPNPDAGVLATPQLLNAAVQSEERTSWESLPSTRLLRQVA